MVKALNNKYNVFIALPSRGIDGRSVSITGRDKDGVEGAKRRIEELVAHQQQVRFCTAKYA